jgi:hypothetical protein
LEGPLRPLEESREKQIIVADHHEVLTSSRMQCPKPVISDWKDFLRPQNVESGIALPRIEDRWRRVGVGIVSHYKLEVANLTNYGVNGIAEQSAAIPGGQQDGEPHLSSAATG